MRRLFAALSVSALAIGIVAGPALAKQPAPAPTIVDVAIAVNSEGPFAGSFDTLIAAVLAADPAVVTTLTSRGQYTVFAPTDDAFAELGLNPGNIGTALSQADLTNILLYHVAKGERYAEDVVESSRIRMLNGTFAMVDGASIDGQSIIVTDVDAPTNGIIHVVDGVLLP